MLVSFIRSGSLPANFRGHHLRITRLVEIARWDVIFESIGAGFGWEPLSAVTERWPHQSRYQPNQLIHYSIDIGGCSIQGTVVMVLRNGNSLTFFSRKYYSPLALA
jgi:hypothetical protein